MISESQRVKIIRTLVGMNAKTFAAKLGVDAQTVSNWENGRSVPAGRGRKALGELCGKAGIEFRADGMPLPNDRL